MIASVLSQKYNVLKTEGNFNNEIGLPLTIFKIREQHEVAVLEMGISEFGEMHRLAEMAYPDICVITNIGLCHLENLLTRDGILKAKTESFEHLTPEGTAVLNGDDDKLCEKKMVNGKPVVFYGIGKEAKLAKTEQGEKYLAEKEVYATDVEPVGLDGTKAVIHIGAESFAVTIPIAGSKRTPEIGHFHCLTEVFKTPLFRERKCTRHIVCHLTWFLKCNDHCHIQWKKYGNRPQNQNNRKYPVCFLFFFHHNCSSFLFMTVIWKSEIATITIKKITAFALWNPNCPPSIPFL